MTVKVVTDSSARLPAAIRALYDIREVALRLLNGDSDFAEGVDEVSEEIVSDPATTTSGVSPADITQALARAVADSDGDGVVAVLMSRRLSGTWSAARLAAEAFPGQIRVVDSRSVGLAVGFAALGAAQAAAGGADLDRAYEAAIRTGSLSETLLCVSQLDNLRASGRIGAATKVFGSALSIKPVLRVVDGALVLAERQRTFSKAISKMIDAAVAVADRRPVILGVLDSGAAEVGDDVAQRLCARLSVRSLIRSDLGPVLSTHVGTGAVGVAICTDLEPIAGFAP
ncbi:DegV family protein [Williamsia sp. CHRR-6]|uniref:DegV family protein n=1 Tax=Williamsia sp. CHRR-6 TaxID=2835871 RepID=UPI001BD9F227|nr:DegV family protein [Williamsia sp. CHRR-6]MBT0565412.1 DegV family protein [Williamsia sp. CHRR-6]